MTADGRVFGIIRPLDRDQPRMELQGTPYQTELAEGTLLLTSGQGGVFPRGIPVGRILRVTDAQVGWEKSYLVEPAVRPGAVREVMVLVDPDAAGAGASSLWERTSPPEGSG